MEGILSFPKGFTESNLTESERQKKSWMQSQKREDLALAIPVTSFAWLLDKPPKSSKSRLHQWWKISGCLPFSEGKADIAHQSQHSSPPCPGTASGVFSVKPPGGHHPLTSLLYFSSLNWWSQVYRKFRIFVSQSQPWKAASYLVSPCQWQENPWQQPSEVDFFFFSNSEQENGHRGLPWPGL